MDAVEIAVNVELEQIARRIARASRRLCFDPRKSNRLQIERIDKGVDEAHRIVGGDVIVDGLWQQHQLRAIGAGDVRHVPILTQRSR